MEVEWAPSRNFIISKIRKQRNGHEELDTQILGWDPRANSIISWHFGNDGSFGFGHWRHEKDARWVIDFSGVATDGTATNAQNVFVVKSPEELSWHSAEKSSDGNSAGDGQSLKILRVK